MLSLQIIEFLAIITTPIVLILLVYSHMQNKKMVQLREKLNEVQENYYLLLDKYETIEAKQEETQAFQESLKEAHLTTTLQASKLSRKKGHGPKDSQDKYQYIRSLCESGMAVPEIADILSLSVAETEQLINLSKLAQK